jgi:hypothetical protein
VRHGLTAALLSLSQRHSNDYEGNLLNAKIESPVDDNFSDDQVC